MRVVVPSLEAILFANARSGKSIVLATASTMSFEAGRCGHSKKLYTTACLREGGLCSSSAIATLPLLQRAFLGLLWAEQQRTGVAEQELGVVVAALAQLGRVHSVWKASVGAVGEIVGQLGRQKLIFCTGTMLGPRCLVTLGCGFGEAELRAALEHTVFKGVVVS